MPEQSLRPRQDSLEARPETTFSAHQQHRQHQQKIRNISKYKCGMDSSSTVSVWLDNQSAIATAYTPFDSPPPRKRRRVLQDMPDNIKRRRSPRKARPSTPEQQQQRTGTEDTGGLDIYATPRAGANPRLSRPSLQSRSGDTSPSRSSTSTSSVARSKSPVKRFGDLQLLSTKIHLVTFDNNLFPLSDAANELCLRLKRIFSKGQLIPDAVKHRAADLLSKFDIDESNFFAGSQPLLSPQPRGSFDEDQTWAMVADILRRARLCEEDFAAEAHWNTQVHARVFDIVLEGWREERNLWYMDVTTAKIHSGQVSKLVDYAFVLTPGLDLHQRVTSTLKGRGELTINHTKAEYLRYKPIVISFETKKPGTDEEGANVQLGVWAEAQFQRLHQLSDIPMDQLFILPQVLVLGHDWRLKIASTPRDGTVVIHGHLGIGDTRTHLGIYKLITALHCLSDWAVEDYQKWFIEKCLV